MTLGSLQMLCVARHATDPASWSPHAQPPVGLLLTPTRRPGRYFLFVSSLIFFLYPIKLPTFCPILLQQETVHFVKCDIECVSPKVSSLILFVREEQEQPLFRLSPPWTWAVLLGRRGAGTLGPPGAAPPPPRPGHPEALLPAGWSHVVGPTVIECFLRVHVAA